jgi:hypothetical protein
LCKPPQRGSFYITLIFELYEHISILTIIKDKFLKNKQTKIFNKWLLCLFCLYLCLGWAPAPESCILVGGWHRSRGQMELWGAGGTVQEGCQCSGGCVWPATWGQNDVGAPKTPRMVADQRGLHEDRSVSSAGAPGGGGCDTTCQLYRVHKVWEMKQNEPHAEFCLLSFCPMTTALVVPRGQIQADPLTEVKVWGALTLFLGTCYVPGTVLSNLHDWNNHLMCDLFIYLPPNFPLFLLSHRFIYFFDV